MSTSGEKMGVLDGRLGSGEWWSYCQIQPTSEAFAALKRVQGIWAYGGERVEGPAALLRLHDLITGTTWT